jgi:uncharacterized protein
VTRTSTFLLFLAVMLAVFGGMHFYLWARLARDTGLPDAGRRAAAVFLAIAALAVPAGIILGRRLPVRTTQALSAVLFTWMGAAFLVTCAVLVADLLRFAAMGARWAIDLAASRPPDPADPARRLFVARAVAGGALVAAGSATARAVRSATGEPTVKEVPVRLARLPPALSGFTLAQISDLHVGPSIREKEVRRVVDLANALRPDAVVITGDLVDASVPELRAAVGHLARLQARRGVYFVTGNHEYYAGAGPWLAELRRLGIRTLENELVTLGDRTPGGSSFDLAGVNDWSVARGEEGRWPALDEAIRGRDPARSLVLLAHQPRGLAEAVAGGVELQLSGHTHGGQIFPWNFVVSAVYPYSKGLYRHGDGQIYVSCGAGFWGPPMRLGAPAEVAKIVLTT